MSPLIASTIASLFSSSFLWAFLQFAMTRRLRRMRHVQAEVDVEKAKEEAKDRERIRNELLATAQATAQQTALDSADRRYQALWEDHNSMRGDMREMKQAAGLIIGAFEGFLMRLRPSQDGTTYSAVVTIGEVDIAREMISAARTHLYR